MAEDAVVPALPNEIFLAIVEWCDVETYMTLRLANKSTKKLIDIFEKPLAIAIAEQEPNFQNTFAYRGTFPSGVELCRRLCRRQTVHEICNLFINGIILTFGSDIHDRSPDGQNLSCADMKAQAAHGTETYVELFRCVENGCAVSWTLAEILEDVKTSIENETSIRQASFDHHFYRQLQDRYEVYLQSLTAFEVLSFRLFYLMKSAHSSIFEETYRFILPRIIFSGMTAWSGRKGRRSTPEVSIERKLSHWISITQITPLSMLGFAKETLASPDPRLDDLRKMAIEKLCPVYLHRNERSQTYQCDIAEIVLDMIDERVSESEIRLSQVMPTAFSVLALRRVLHHRWLKRSIDDGFF